MTTCIHRGCVCFDLGTFTATGCVHVITKSCMLQGSIGRAYTHYCLDLRVTATIFAPKIPLNIERST